MGRQSPGKWIRNLLLGKKSSSKSNSSKNKDTFKPSSNKDVLVVSSEASVSSANVISAATSGDNATKGVQSEKEVASKSSKERVILSSGDEQPNSQAYMSSGSEHHLETIRLKEAAITAQAAVRGYLARRTFQTLKGVIPLQALIRGQLVRRQAVSALYCVKGIVKLQALARGYKVRHSDIGLAVQKIFKDIKCSNSGVATSTQAEKLSDNVFVHKLLASSPSSVPLYLKYQSGEPNMAWKEWVDRWTRSRFWALVPPELKKLNSISGEKNGSCQTVETTEGQVKSNAKKTPAVKVEDGSVSDSNKYKRRTKKDPNLPQHSAKEHHQQKESEKSNVKKTHTQNSANDKRKHITRKISDHTVTDVSKQGPSASSDKVKDLAVSNSKEYDLEKSLGQQEENEHNNESHNKDKSNRTNGKDGVVNEDLSGGDNCISNESPKNFKRRASLPANLNDRESEIRNTKLPSYMAPTESAKAKLRGQCSPTYDLLDRNSITRRLSLSSSLNGKLGSFSPRSDRFVAMSSSKGLIRTDRSLSSSRDGLDKFIQPQWRR